MPIPRTRTGITRKRMILSLIRLADDLRECACKLDQCSDSGIQRHRHAVELEGAVRALDAWSSGTVDGTVVNCGSDMVIAPVAQLDRASAF